MKTRMKSLVLLTLFIPCKQANSMDSIKRGVKDLGNSVANFASGTVNVTKGISAKPKETAKVIGALVGAGLAFQHRQSILNLIYSGGTSTLSNVADAANSWSSLSKTSAKWGAFIGGAYFFRKFWNRHSALRELRNITESFDNKDIKASDRKNPDEIAKKWHFWGWRKDSVEDGKSFTTGYSIDKNKGKDNKDNLILKALIDDAKVDGRIYIVNNGRLFIPTFEKDKLDILTQDTFKAVKNKIDSELEELEDIQNKINGFIGGKGTCFLEEQLLKICDGEQQNDTQGDNRFSGKTLGSAMRFFVENKLESLKQDFVNKFKDKKVRTEMDTSCLSCIPIIGDDLADWSCQKLYNFTNNDKAFITEKLCLEAASVYFETEKLYGRLMALRDIVCAQIKPSTGDMKKDDKKAENPAVKAKEICEKFKKIIEDTRNKGRFIRNDFRMLNDSANESSKALDKILKFDDNFLIMSVHELVKEAHTLVGDIDRDLVKIVKLNNAIRETDDEDDEDYRRRGHNKKERKMFDENDQLAIGMERFQAWIDSMDFIIKKLGKASPPPSFILPVAPKGDGHNPLIDNSNLNASLAKKETDEKRNKEDEELLFNV